MRQLRPGVMSQSAAFRAARSWPQCTLLMTMQGQDYASTQRGHTLRLQAGADVCQMVLGKKVS